MPASASTPARLSHRRPRTRRSASARPSRSTSNLTNNSLDSDTFNVFSTLTGSTKFGVKFFVGATDVTARVNAATYNFTLNAGQTITIRIQVTAKSGTAASATRNIDLTMKSKSSTSKDVVRGHVTRA